jgi:hypothetical protein
MIGDYTKVPLRATDRWTGARMQQGRVLLDHEWNLNVDAAARAVETAVLEAVGPAGVLRGSNGFNVSVNASGAVNVSVAAGHMWVGGLLAVLPADLDYASQPGIAALPGSGRAIVYLEAWEEHVQPAEDGDLVEPALAPTDTASRTRVGYRVRAAATTATTCRDAWAGVALTAGSTGTIGIAAVAAPTSSDPCAPPAAAATLLPDGLLRVEVLDGGDQAHARFAWSFENGSAAAPVLGGITSAVINPATSDGDVEVDLTVAALPGVRFGFGDLVELSWLERRADRVAHGELYRVTGVDPGATGDRLTLKRHGGYAAPPANAHGVVVRRWDGQGVGAGPFAGSWRGTSYVTIAPGAGQFAAGDWWGSRLRSGANGVEERTAAAPDGTLHAFAPLGLVDLGARTVHDCRPTFRPLTALGGGTCTVTVAPGDDLQDAVDSLPVGGGQVCFAAGVYPLAAPLLVDGRTRVVLHGAGPSTVLAAAGTESAVVFSECSEVEVRDLRILGGSPPQSTPDLDGALTFLACTEVRVSGCVLGCAPASSLQQTCLTVRSDIGVASDLVRVEDNRFEVGANQTGVLLVDVGELRVSRNRVALRPDQRDVKPDVFARQGIVVGGTRASIVQILDNVVEDAAQGIHVGLSDQTSTRYSAGDVLVRGNVVGVKIPTAYAQDRHAVFVGNADCIHVVGTAAKLTRFGTGTPTRVEAVKIFSSSGPFMTVRETCTDGFDVGVLVVLPGANLLPKQRMWFVDETMAANGTLALDAPEAVVDGGHNVPMPQPAAISAVAVSPAAAGAATQVQGTITLDGPALRSQSVTIAVLGANGGPSNLVTPQTQTVTLTPGSANAPFTLAVASSVPADQVLTVQATLGQKTVQTTFQALAQAAVKSVTLSQYTVTGGTGVTITGTVELTKAAPGQAVQLSSSNGNLAAPAQGTLTIASGTTGTFTINVFATSSQQPVDIVAKLGPSQQHATLTDVPAPLPKVHGIRVLDTDGNELYNARAAGSGFFPNRSILIDADSAPARVEVTFTQPIDGPNVHPTSNFTVQHAVANLAQPANQHVVQPSNTVLVWTANSMPASLTGTAPSKTTTYTVTLVGDGANAIKSKAGRRLDGELTGFDSGDGAEGGNAVFTIKVIRYRDIDNSHIYDKNDPHGTNVP